MIEDILIRWMEADKAVSDIKKEADAVEQRLKAAQAESDSARDAAKDYMAETGEYQVDIEGGLADYQIYWTAARESLKVENPDAVPDEFCKIERKPKLREIADYIKDNPVNWAVMEKGTSKLTYKLKKKG